MPANLEEVAWYVAQGCPNQMIADLMDVSYSSVANAVSALYDIYEIDASGTGGHGAAQDAVRGALKGAIQLDALSGDENVNWSDGLY